ncbi:MAG: FAD-binding protein, partial [Clostridium lundense]|nr:FAD-binding protein [Clostridium lundense]
MSISRRDLVKFGGSACLVAGLAAGTAMADEAAGYLVGAPDVNFTVETDALIIGTGMAGLAAAMEPALAGKKVILADKRGNWGGDSLSTCWFMFGTGTKNQLDNGATT